MEKVMRLNEAFESFTQASRSLEVSYSHLQERILHLTMEVESKNRQLKNALSDSDEARDYLKGILENLNEAIMVLDADSTIVMINRAAKDLLDVEPDRFIGESIESLEFSRRNKALPRPGGTV